MGIGIELSEAARRLLPASCCNAMAPLFVPSTLPRTLGKFVFLPDMAKGTTYFAASRPCLPSTPEWNFAPRHLHRVRFHLRQNFVLRNCAGVPPKEIIPSTHRTPPRAQPPVATSRPRLRPGLRLTGAPCKASGRRKWDGELSSFLIFLLGRGGSPIFLFFLGGCLSLLFGGGRLPFFFFGGGVRLGLGAQIASHIGLCVLYVSHFQICMSKDTTRVLLCLGKRNLGDDQSTKPSGVCPEAVGNEALRTQHLRAGIHS